MKSAVVALAVSVAVVGGSLAPAMAQTKDPALDKLAADWAAAFAKGDAKTLAGFYTENAVRMTPEGGTVVGRAAIEKEFAGNVAGPWKGAKIAIKVGSTHPVGTDVAVNEGTWEVSGATGPDGKPVTLRGNYVNTIVKKGGAWMIASNSAAPPAPAPTR
ncbi:MAG TPA: nuclear transport factor 2 family protein [Vicinamibacteria bacterium]|nr:nuclear transport factor 2 family protein [Vicinamibacteria bacterium]